MVKIKVCFEGDYNIITSVNGTMQEIENYYVGKLFNIGVVADDIRVCLGVELV